MWVGAMVLHIVVNRRGQHENVLLSDISWMPLEHCNLPSCFGISSPCFFYTLVGTGSLVLPSGRGSVEDAGAGTVDTSSKYGAKTKRCCRSSHIMPVVK